MDNTDLFIGFVRDRYPDPLDLLEIINPTTEEVVDKFYEEILDNPTLWSEYSNEEPDPYREEGQ